MSKLLARIEAVLNDQSLAGELASIEAALPVGVRPRQCSVRTLAAGMLCCLADGRRSAHLKAVHGVLVGLEPADRERLGVLAPWRSGAHLLSYRQVTYTAQLIAAELAKERPDGGCSARLQRLVDALVEASVPEEYKGATGSYAIDWTDVESFFRPPSAPDGPSADPEAAWGHRRGDSPGHKDELFFGYYGSLMTMVPELSGPPLPELVRRAQLSSCRHDPVPGFVAVVTNSAVSGVVVSEVLADTGYSYKVPEHFAIPLRRVGAKLVIDLHPNDRGQKGIFAGAILNNGNLYCPATPSALLGLGPLGKGASDKESAAHDERTGELFAYKLGRLSNDDADGYHRVTCPAELHKLRCPLRPASMALPFSRPEVFDPPELAPRCCAQTSVTVPPEVNAKTRQRHDYPGAAWRRAYARRSGVERANSRLKDPAGIDLDVPGWCKLAGIVPLALFFSCACVIVNFELIDAFEQRQARRGGRSTPPEPKRRRRRRRTLADLAAGANAPP